jgi:hypothetical protein
MSCSPLPCINTNEHISLGGLSHHPVVEMTSTKNGRAKMHVKLVCHVDQRPTKLSGCTKHIEPQHGEYMECDSMNRDVENQDGKHQWYLMM